MVLALLLAAAPQTIAVLELHDTTDLSAAYLADQVRAAAKEALPSAKVITRENMLVLLQASGKDLADCEGECEVDTARRIGADLVVSGELLKFGTQYKLNLKLHEVRSGELLSGAVAAGTTADDLDRALAPAMDKLFATLRSGAPPPREGGLVGLQLHGGAGYAYQELAVDPNHVAATGGAFTLAIGGDVTWHASPSLWIGPWLDVVVTRSNSEATDTVAAGGLLRFPAGPVRVAGGLGFAALRDENGWAAMVEADWPLWKALAAHAQVLAAHGMVGIGVVSGDDSLYVATAGLSLVY